MRKFITLISGLLLSVMAFSAGFQLNEHSATYAAMGNATVANARNASAIFYNPAGLTSMTGLNISFNSTLVYPESSWYSLDGSLKTDQKKHLNVLPAVYVTKQLNDRVTVGIGEFSQYGLQTDWPAGWPGTELANRTYIRTFYISPTISFKVTDTFSVGIQANYVLSDVLITNQVNFVDQFADVEMSGDGDGWGGSFGFQWNVTDKFHIGGMWRSKVTIHFDGDVDFDNVPRPFLPILYDGPITAKVTLPQTWALGFSYQYNERLEIAFELFHTDWSSYDKLEAVRANGQILKSSPKYWKNVDSYRLGIAYKINDEFTFKCGYIYDENPAPDETVEPTLPDSDRNDYSVGLDWHFSKNLTISSYFMYVHFNDRTVNGNLSGFDGVYKTDAYLLGFGLDYRF